MQEDSPISPGPNQIRSKQLTINPKNPEADDISSSNPSLGSTIEPPTKGSIRVIPTGNNQFNDEVLAHNDLDKPDQSNDQEEYDTVKLSPNPGGEDLSLDEIANRPGGFKNLKDSIYLYQG